MHMQMDKFGHARLSSITLMRTNIQDLIIASMPKVLVWLKLKESNSLRFLVGSRAGDKCHLPLRQI